MKNNTSKNNNSTNSHEVWKKVGTSEKGHRIYYVSNQGRCKTVNAKTGRVISINRGARNAYTGYMTFAGSLVHRLVCQAFNGPSKDPEAKYVCHENATKEDNRAQNLSWGTCAENNNNELTQLKRSVSYTRHSHEDEIIRAEKNGVVRWFKNGIQAAREIGCTHVLVYNSIGHKQSARKARGWELSWRPMQEYNEWVIAEAAK